MNYQHLQEIINHYIDFFPVSNNAVHMEYYKWKIIHDFRPMMDDALASSDEKFPNKLYAIKRLTQNLIDSYTQPFNGLVAFSKKEPATVRRMFTELYRATEADVKEKQAAIRHFLDQSHVLRDKYYPGSYLYNDDLHSVTGYLFLYDPDHNYLYKATHCRDFADCIEFYDDWGYGEYTKLDVFFRMCDETLEAIKQNEALMATAESRLDIDREHMCPDTEKHILLFDIIYCCSTYGLFKGIRYVVPKNSERQLIQARKEKARELKQALDEAEAKASELARVQQSVSEKVTAGTRVKHRKFGEGEIISVDNDTGRFTICFSDGEKELGINPSLSNGLITAEGLELTRDEIGLLRDERKIKSAVSYAEKAMAPYLEYLE